MSCLWSLGKSALKFGEGILDGTPGVGHVKGAIHYLAGDTEHATKCVVNATRSATVLVAGALTGGAGAPVALGGFAGLGAGMVYDNKVSSAVHGEPVGIIYDVKEAWDTKDLYKFATTGLSIAGDFASGTAGAQYGKGLRVKHQKQKLEQSFQDMKDTGKMSADFDPKLATEDTIDAAKNMNKHVENGTIKGDGHVSSRVRNLETKEVSQGYSSRARADLNVAEFEAKGKSSGFKSKTNAKIAAKRMPSKLKAKQPHVNPAPGMNRDPASCAEHEAFNNHYKTTGASTGNAQTVNVEYRDGNYSTVKRCPNCSEYDMGRVPTDTVSGKTVPTTDASGKIGPFIGGACISAATTAYRVTRREEKEEEEVEGLN